MENEDFISSSTHLSWQSSMAPAPVMNSAQADQLQSCFVNLNWDHSMDQSSHFESALSSIVSSPSNHPPPPPPAAAAAAENFVIRELIGRLGSICNSSEISPHSQGYLSGGNNNSTTTSCYTTPLNSPPKLGRSMAEHHLQAWGNLPISGNLVPPPATTHLAPFAADPGFAERAARYSCFGGRSYGGLPGQFMPPEPGKLSRVSSSKSLMAGGSQIGPSENKEVPMQEGSQLDMEMRSMCGTQLSRSSTPEDGERGSAREESSASAHTTATVGNARKRKAVSKAKPKEAPASRNAKDTPKVAEDESNAKRCRSTETKVEQNSGAVSGDAGQKQEKENNSKPPEPPKQDYICVRARRGQATDSHSLAERVRREKISERMKFLQDLVPGCNKVTGKAVMLDEIINYVQSLQRQVEFLSMKLATVNPRLDFNVENLLQKDIHQLPGSLPHSIYPIESSAPGFPFAQQHPQDAPAQSIVTNGMENHCPLNPLDATLRRSLSMQLPPLEGLRDAASLMGSFWEDDLHSVVQMGFGQNQEGTFSSQPFHGALPTSHMKVEL